MDFFHLGLLCGEANTTSWTITFQIRNSTFSVILMNKISFPIFFKWGVVLEKLKMRSVMSRIKLVSTYILNSGCKMII